MSKRKIKIRLLLLFILVIISNLTIKYEILTDAIFFMNIALLIIATFSIFTIKRKFY